MIASPRSALRSPLALLLGIALTAPGGTAVSREPSLAERYVRVSAATAAGDMDVATSEMAALLAREPASPEIALRAYRQALTAGDHALATRALRLLDGLRAMPVDGPLLLATDAIGARDWKAAEAAVVRLEQGKLFAFMAPLLRGWIALASRDGDPLAALEPARTLGFAAGYHAEQHAFLLIALGRAREGAAEIQRTPTSGMRARIIAAGALAAARDKPGALALLSGDEAPIVTARTRIAAGRKPGVAIEDAGDGLAELFARVAGDFNRQRLVPVATLMARLATFVAPDRSGGWLATAQVLALAKRPAAAIAALDHVTGDDPFAEAARTMRVSLLIDSGDRKEALDQAMRAARARNAGATAWARVGDVQMALEHFGEAADAYGKAIALAADLPPAQTWAYWLQQGGAYERGGDWPRARAALEKAAALAPDQPVALNHLGYSLLARREEVVRAQGLIAKASALRPDDPAITDSLGWARFVGGRPGEAAPLLERAAAGAPDEPTINEHLGDVYWSLGRRLEARYAWRAALVTAEARDAPRLTSKIDLGLTEATASP